MMTSFHVNIAIEAQERRENRIISKRWKPRGETRFPAICRHAKMLGVNRVTLYRMLTGRCKLTELRVRYDALIAKEERQS